MKELCTNHVLKTSQRTFGLLVLLSLPLWFGCLGASSKDKLKEAQAKLEAAQEADEAAAAAASEREAELTRLREIGDELTGDEDAAARRMTWLRLMKSISECVSSDDEGDAAKIVVDALEAEARDDVGEWFEGLSKTAIESLPVEQQETPPQGKGFVITLKLRSDAGEPAEAFDKTCQALRTLAGDPENHLSHVTVIDQASEADKWRAEVALVWRPAAAAGDD